MRIPNVYLVGAPRSGTTTLAWCLARHPRICLSEPKEPNYYASRYHLGTERYLQTYFPHWGAETLACDASTSYLFLPWVTQRLRSDVPDAKVVVILREPAMRLWSEWSMNRGRKVESRPFAQVVELEERQLGNPWWNRPDAETLWAERLLCLEQRRLYPHHPYFLPGMYAEHLKRYFAAYPRENVLVLWTRDLERNPGATLQRLSTFLGLDAPLPVAPYRENPARGPLGNVLNRYAERLRLHKILPQSWVRACRDFLIRAGDRPPAPDEKSLGRLREVYRPHNQALAELLGEEPRW